MISHWKVVPSHNLQQNKIWRYQTYRERERERAIGIYQIQNTKAERLQSIEQQTYERRRDLFGPEQSVYILWRIQKSLATPENRTSTFFCPTRRKSDGVIYTYKLGDFESSEDQNNLKKNICN